MISCRNVFILIWRKPIARTFFILTVVTFLIILPVCLRSVQNSLYFMQLNKTYAEQDLITKNSERLHDAEQFFQLLSPFQLRSIFNETVGDSNSSKIVLSIITVSRNRHQIDSYEPKYLTQVAWKVLTLLY